MNPMEGTVPEQVAFAPKADFQDPDCLGAVFVNDSTEINVREAIKAGKGYIVTDDDAIIQRLDKYEPLKRVSLAEAQKSKPSRAAASSGGGNS